MALRDIAADPERVGSIARGELGNDIRSYHLRYRRDRARTEHGPSCDRATSFFIGGRLQVIEIGRALHDAMELQRRLPTRL